MSLPFVIPARWIWDVLYWGDRLTAGFADVLRQLLFNQWSNQVINFRFLWNHASINIKFSKNYANCALLGAVFCDMWYEYNFKSRQFDIFTNQYLLITVMRKPRIALLCLEGSLSLLDYKSAIHGFLLSLAHSTCQYSLVHPLLLSPLA